jgi:hypothetical protein
LMFIWLYTGWCFGTWILFVHSVGNVITPTDELIFFRGVETTNPIYRFPRYILYIYIDIRFWLKRPTTESLNLRGLLRLPPPGYWLALEPSELA